MDFKREEIREYAKDNIMDCCTYDADYIIKDISDIHHELFNTDYYIIGTYQATQWLGNQVFNIINFIKEYENDNFGKVNTDFSDAEKVVNMYTYIIGEEIVQKYVEDMEKNKKVA